MNRLLQLFHDVARLWTKYSSVYMTGVKNTLLLSLIATFIGVVIGFVCGILQTIPVHENDSTFKKVVVRIVKVIIRIYVEVFRGTPMVLQSVFIYYGLPYFTNNSVQFTSVWTAAIFIVSINTGAYMAETVRGGIMSIDPGQTEGAQAIGMSHYQTMVYVILPQVLKNILPQIGNNFIINVKDTSVLFIISFTEFFAVHRTVVGASYLYFPSATIEMIGYLIMTLVSSLILRFWEKKLEGNDTYSLATTDQLSPTAGLLNYPKHGSNFDERNIEVGKRGH